MGTVAELLEEIESENLYQVLVTVDGRTLRLFTTLWVMPNLAPTSRSESPSKKIACISSCSLSGLFLICGVVLRLSIWIFYISKIQMGGIYGEI